MGHKRLAVLTAVYNDQEGLEVTLGSLPADCEMDLFVVDDGSSPPIQLPPSYTESLSSQKVGVFLVRLEKNGGAAKARNVGLARIWERGYEYVAILDAGDIALPGRFSKPVEFLDKNPEYALVGGQLRFLATDGHEVPEPLPLDFDSIVRGMHARVCFSHSAVTFRADVLREIGGYREDFEAAHDYELFWRIIRRGYKVANLPDVLVEYRLNPRGITVRKRRRQIVNKLRVMLSNFDPRVPESYLGVIKQLSLLALPFPWVWRIKRMLPKRPGWL